jgi:hypothetical protein
LSDEDYEFMDDKESDYSFPDFGNSQSSYEDVSDILTESFFVIGDSSPKLA